MGGAHVVKSKNHEIHFVGGFLILCNPVVSRYKSTCIIQVIHTKSTCWDPNGRLDETISFSFNCFSYFFIRHSSGKTRSPNFKFKSKAKTVFCQLLENVTPPQFLNMSASDVDFEIHLGTVSSCVPILIPPCLL